MELTAQKKSAMRCEDCGFEFPGEGMECCPRCGAAVDGTEVPLPAMPHEAVNPYSEKYSRLRARVDAGDEPQTAIGDFVVSLEDKAAEGDSMAQHFLGRYIYWERANEHARKLLEESAARGNAFAETDLGEIYGNGNDNYAAIRLFRKAAAQGFSHAITDLAAHYSHGAGLVRNEEKAARLMCVAAGYGDANAQYDMYLRYRQGNGVGRDAVAALMWCNRAADRGLAAAEYEMACCFRDGYGVAQDLRESVRWLERATGAGDLRATLLLSIDLCHGIGTEKDPERAFYLATSAVEREYDEALWQLSYYYRNGIGVKADEAAADKWLLKALDSKASFPWRSNLTETAKKDFPVRMRWAADRPDRTMKVFWWARESGYEAGAAQALRRGVELGSAEAQWVMGACLEEGLCGFQASPQDAVAFYGKSSEQGNAAGEWHLGLAYQHGIAVEKDLARAESLFRSAAEKGNVDAAYLLAVMLDAHEAQEREPGEAVKWLKKAAEAGSARAMHLYGRWLLDGVNVPADTFLGLEYMDAAGRNGLVAAWKELGDRFFNGENAPLDYRMSFQYRENCARAGDVDSCKAVAAMYEQGYGCVKNPEKAREFTDMAVSLGATAEAGEATPQNDGPHDSGTGFRWFQIIFWLSALLCIALALSSK